LPQTAEKSLNTEHYAEIVPLGGVSHTHSFQKGESFAAESSKTGFFFLVSDSAAMLLAFVIGAFVAKLINPEAFQDFLTSASLRQFAIYAGLGAVTLLWLDTKGHYRSRLPYWETLGHIVSLMLVGFVAGGFIQFAIKSHPSRLWLGASWGLFGILLYFGRMLVRRAFEARGKWEIPALVIGCGPTAAAAQKALLSEPEMGYRVVAALGSEKLVGLERPNAWAQLLRKMNARHIFLALEGADLEKYKAAIKALGRDRLPYAILPSLVGLPLNGLSTHHFMMHDVMLLQDTNPLRLLLPRLVKRSFDIVAAGGAFMVLLPVFLLIALIVRTDGGPVFFNQPRLGKKGKIFNCHKFRSMRTDAEDVLMKFLRADPAMAGEWKNFQKLKRDPRLTRFGAFIRRTSLDELPQLLNVLKGDMSLVGPRPIMLGQEVYYGDEIASYCAVHPGITGPWQVSGRNRLTFPQRVELEAWYTRNWTFWMDIVIILKTFPALLHRDTAF